MLATSFVPANIYLFLKVTSENTKKICTICSKLSIKTPKLLYFFWTYLTPFSSVSIVNLEQVDFSWVIPFYALTGNEEIEYDRKHLSIVKLLWNIWNYYKTPAFFTVLRCIYFFIRRSNNYMLDQFGSLPSMYNFPYEKNKY